jgi:outer membrane protein assembly factor BamA
LISDFNNIGKILLLAIIISLSGACNIAKHARKDGTYLYKNSIKIKEKEIARFYSSGLESQIKQLPNKKLFGFYRLRLHLFFWGTGGNDNKIKRFLRYNIGESPVILDSTYIESGMKNMKAFLKTQGFYYPEIKYQISGKPNKSKVNFDVSLGKPYFLYSIGFHISDKKIDSIVQANKEDSYLREGNPIKLENLFNEQTRITELLRNNGYYDFSKEAIEFDFDTAWEGGYKSFIAINIKNPENFKRYETFSIKDINVEVDLPGSIDSIQLVDTLKLENFNFISHGYKLDPKVFMPLISVKKGSIFSQRRSNRTFQRLNDLQIFRTVNISTNLLPDKNDSNKLNYQIRLVPAKKYDISFEPQIITTDQANLVTGSSFRNYGFATMATTNINNIFRGAEVLQIRYRISVEAQRGPSISTVPFFNSFESSLSANLIIPKLVGLNWLDNSLSGSVNKTIIASSVIYEQNVSWLRNVFTIGYNYQFSKRLVTYNFAPAEISFIKTNFANQTLEEQSKNDPYLQSIFANNLITNSRFGLLYSNQSNKKIKNFIYFRWDALEIAGIIPRLIFKALNKVENDSGYYTIYNVRFFNYVKSYVDFRYNHFLDVNNRVVFRLAGGVALPFWNSPDFVPFDKRFFNGGANSIRAFLPRSLGPGSYNVAGQLDRSGDVKLEANFEYRFNIFNRYIEGAIFGDAGNIWRIKDDGRAEAAFHFDSFYKQLAVGAGAGIRLNLDFLVFRVDWALPIFDPRKIEGERYVFKTYKDLGLLWDESIFNFGVGYPF